MKSTSDSTMVFRKPKPDSDSPALRVEKLYEYAVKALARLARSRGEIHALLRKRKASAADIETILARLHDNGYLDDARFARTFVAYRIENDLHGPRRIQQDLRLKKVDPEIAAQAVADAFVNLDEAKHLRRYLARKVRLSNPITKPSQFASLYRRLLRAGFSSATIVRELKNIRHGTSSGNPAETDPPRWEECLESLAETPGPDSDIGE